MRLRSTLGADAEVPRKTISNMASNYYNDKPRALQVFFARADLRKMKGCVLAQGTAFLNSWGGGALQYSADYADCSASMNCK